MVTALMADRRVNETHTEMIYMIASFTRDSFAAKEVEVTYEETHKIVLGFDRLI